VLLHRFALRVPGPYPGGDHRFVSELAWTRRDLLRQGWTDRRLADAVADGRLVRLRKGHYADPGLDAVTSAAVAEGGWLSCASELQRRGVWVHDPQRKLHVRMPPGEQRGRRTRDVVRHWSSPIDAPALRVSVFDAMADAFHCLAPMGAVAALDSCLHKGLLRPSRLEELSRVIGRQRAAWLSRADARAESGLETIARLRLGLLGIPCRSQVRFEGVGRVDLLVAERLVVEADGDAYHSSKADRQRDRGRDARLADRGCPTLRFGSEQLLSVDLGFELAVIGVLDQARGVKNRGEVVKKARNRLHSIDLATVLHGNPGRVGGE